MSTKSYSSVVVLRLVQLAALFILTLFIFNFRKYPYADDWTYVSPLSMDSIKEFVTWLFAQHVDHRIPIQKIIQYGLVRISGYDFRVLVFFNVMIAFLASMILAAAAKIYRGRQHYGDLIIPLILINPASGYGLWAFEFQFLSSIFFMSAAIYFACRYTETRKPHFLAAVFLQLFFCSLCGINGVIFSTVLSAGILVYFLYEAKIKNEIKKLTILYSTLVLAGNMILWLLWSPSAASVGMTSFASIFEIFFKLLSASMIVFTFSHGAWKTIVIVVLLILAAYGVFVKFKKEKFDFSDIVLTLSLLASLAVILSIAIGRSKAQGGWNDGLAMHYGSLTIFLPILSWWIISKFLSRGIGTLTSIVCIIFFVCAYYENYAWRYGYAESIFDKQYAVDNAIKKDKDIPKLVDKYVMDFTWRDDPDSKLTVINGISALRSRNFPIYKIDSLFDVASTASAQEINNSNNMVMDKSQIVGNNSNSFKFDEFDEKISASKTILEECSGSIDVVNNISPSPATFSTSGVLRVSGWLAASIEKPSLPEAVYLILTDELGNHKYLRAHSAARPDVGAYFKKPELNQSGYSTIADISSLHGSYTLGLGMKNSGKVTICSQFKIPATITN